MSPPDHPLDELLSAYLDDEVSADERVQVDGALATDPTLADRRRRLAAVIAALEPAISAPEEVVDAQIARAMAASVVDLAAARRSRRRPVVIAAAAVIAGVFLLGSLFALRQEDEAQLADGAATDQPSTTNDEALVLEAETASATAAGTDEERDGEDGAIGDFAADSAEASSGPSVDPADPELVAAVRAVLEDPEGQGSALGVLERACAEQVEAVLGPVEAAGRATIDGMPFVVVVGADRIALVDEVCNVTVAARPLP